MLLGCIIGDIAVLDGDGVDGIACAVYAFDLMEIVHATVHGLKVRDVGLVDGHRVHGVIGSEVEIVIVTGDADVEREAFGVDLLVDEYGIVAIVAAGPDGERVGQHRYLAHELVVGIHRVVKRAVNGGARGEEEQKKERKKEQTLSISP